MGEAPKEGAQLEISTDHDPDLHPVEEKKTTASVTIDHPRPRNYRWWIRVSVYSFFVLAGQSVATLLGRLYYDKGGKSKWLATFVQLAGFPLVVPLYCLVASKSRTEHVPGHNSGLCHGTNAKPSYKRLAFVYVSLGVLVAVDSFLYSVGLLYLPVSTYSLISATQLAFNAFFSFFLNSQKFTPFIVNSLVLLTISSTLLVFQPDSSSSNMAGAVSKAKYMIGFICTVAASAGYGLLLSLTQLSFRKVIKRETFKAVLEMLIYQSFVASSIIFVGLFASGDWTHLKREMEDYQLGKVSYATTLAWTAISWGIFSLGAIGLIFDVSSLFSNSISTVGLPIVPVFAAVFFHDSMDGIKVVSMVLAVWGFASYVYQHYLDEAEEEEEGTTGIRIRESGQSVRGCILVNHPRHELAFTPIFAYILNSQKFTPPPTINSILVLTVSSILLVIRPDSASSNTTDRVSGEKYAVGFVCTHASAGCALLFNIVQLYLQKVSDRTPIAAVFEFVIHESAIATGIALVGPLASGKWRTLGQEMEGFGHGKLSYALTLTRTAITWQCCTIRVREQIYEVSSVFSNVITLCCSSTRGWTE